MKLIKSLIWTLPTLLITIFVWGGFSQPWAQTNTAISIFFLLVLLLGYISYKIFFSPKFEFRIHFLHVFSTLGVFAVILSTLLSQDRQYSLFGTVATPSDSGILLGLLLISIGILPQLPFDVRMKLYRGFEIGSTISALYTGILQVLPTGIEALLQFWSWFGFVSFPAILIAPNISTALVISAIFVVSFITQGVFELAKSKKNIKKLTYFGLSLLVQFALLIMFIGESAPVFGYLLIIIGVTLLVGIMAQKGLLIHNNRVTKSALLIYGLVAVIVISAIVSPTLLTLRSQTNFISSYSIPTSLSSISINPIFGSGPGTISIAWNQFYPQSFNETPTWSEQRSTLLNEGLDLLVQYGIFGSVILISGYLSIMYFGYVTILRRKLTFSPIYYVSFIGLVLIGFVSLVISLDISLLILACIFLSIFIGEHFQERVFTLYKIQKQTKDISPTVLSLASFLGIFVYIGVAVYGFNYIQVLASDIYLQRGVRSEAVEDGKSNLQRSLQLYPSNPQAARAYAQILLPETSQLIAEETESDEPDRERIEEKVQELFALVNTQLDSHPNDVGSLDLVASVYNSLQRQINIDQEEYLIVLEKLEEQAPNDPRVDIYRADYYIVQHVQQVEEEEVVNEEFLTNARESLDRAIEKKRDFAPAYIRYDTILGLRGNNPGAIDKLEEYVLITQERGVETDIGVVTVLAQKYLEEDRLDESQGIIEQILAVSPESDTALFLQGRIQEERGQLEQALEWYQRANEVDPDNPVLIEKIQSLGGEVEQNE